MAEKCEHNTAVTVHEPTFQAPYRVSVCTWGCQEYLISLEHGRVTRTWAVSELLAARVLTEVDFLVEGVAHG